MRHRSPKTFVKIRSGRKLFLVPNPVMSGKKCPRAECRDDEELLVKSDRPRMGEINARCQCAARSAVLSDFIARRGRAVGFHCAARSAALSNPLRGAKRRAVGFQRAARSAARRNATAHPPPTLYPRPQAGGLLIIYVWGTLGSYKLYTLH